MTELQEFPPLDEKINVKNIIYMGYETMRLVIKNITYIYYKQPFIHAQIFDLPDLTEVRNIVKNYKDHSVAQDINYEVNWYKLNNYKHFIFISDQEVKTEMSLIYGTLYYKEKRIYSGHFKQRIFYRNGVIYMNNYQLKAQFDLNGKLHKQCEILYNGNEYIKFIIKDGLNYPIEYKTTHNLIIHFHRGINCTILYPFGSIYIGSYIIDSKKVPVVRRHGYGKFTTNKGIEFAGTFVNDKKDGLFMIRESYPSLHHKLKYTVYVYNNDSIEESYIDAHDYMEKTQKQLKTILGK